MVEKNNSVNSRTLHIYNFRNLGAYAMDDGDDVCRLKINRSLDPKMMGGLVFLIGLNNSGKSNVLDALECYEKGTTGSGDIPDFIIDNHREPKLIMIPSNDNPVTRIEPTSITVTDSVKNILISSYREEHESNFTLGPPRSNMDRLMMELALEIRKRCNNTPVRIRYEDFVRNLKNIAKKKNLPELFSNIIDTDDTNTMRLILNQNISYSYSSNPESEPTSYKRDFSIYRYSHDVIRSSDLHSSPTNLNKFFTALIPTLGGDLNILQDLYKNPESKKGQRNRYCNLLNERLKIISSEFNNMFSSDPENRYNFSMDFETEHLYFLIERGTISLNLDRQSQGFRWMFDFFMNFLEKIQFRSGDIVLMDEFGYGLNPQSVKELVRILRLFAQDTGITFVIATQNFMVVDIQHLDEIRLLINESNGNSKIINEFDQFDHLNHDVIKPLLDGLTIGRHYLRSEGKRTVYVEGAMDYFYLTAVTNWMIDREGLNVDLEFLPINGLGRTKKDRKEVIKSIKNIDPSAIMLIDNDEAGRKFKEEHNEDGITIFTLSELLDDDSVKTIENLFSDEDRKKLKVDEKSFDSAACFNQHYLTSVDNVDETTRINFKKIISQLYLG